MKKPGRDLAYAGNAGFSYDSMQWILVDGPNWSMYLPRSKPLAGPDPLTKREVTQAAFVRGLPCLLPCLVTGSGESGRLFF